MKYSTLIYLFDGCFLNRVNDDLLLCADDQHGAVCMADDLFGRASHKKFFETRFSIGSHHDQVNAPAACYLNDTLVRLAYRG